jgi:hypothetical protein
MHTVWVDPELLLEHQGVRVFQTYREDDYGQGARDYWFTANSLCGELDRLCDDQPCRHVFDVRELSTWKAREQPPYCIGVNDTPENHAAWQRYWESEPAAIRAAITAAIEQGELTPRGRLESMETKSNAAPAGSTPAEIGPGTMHAAIPETSLDQY